LLTLTTSAGFDSSAGSVSGKPVSGWTGGGNVVVVVVLGATVVVVAGGALVVVVAAVVADVFGDALLQAPTNAAPPARASICRRDMGFRQPAGDDPESLVGSLRPFCGCSGIFPVCDGRWCCRRPR
jgi:hypothetical protein